MSLEPCVDVHRKQTPAHRELEFRLGSYDSVTNAFSSGVDRETFDHLEQDISDALTSDRLWNEFVDYFYVDEDGNTLRTRVTFDSKTLDMQVQHVRKETLSSAVVCRDDDTRDACRVTCSVEHPVDHPPTSCIIRFVRVQQRRRFYDVRGDNTVWMFELSKTWSANSRDAVEYQQHNTEPHYEVECELVDRDGTYLSERTSQEVAESILLKIRMLLGDDMDAKLNIRDTLATQQRRGRKRKG